MAEYKQWRNTERTPLKDVVPLKSPYNIIIETSSLCNARCVYCGHSKAGTNFYKGNMSLDMYKKIIEEVHDFPDKIKLFEMFGFGEPLCNPNLDQMIRIAKNENVVDKISITTNGLLLNKEKIDELVDSGIDIIRISIQGLSEKKYQDICGVKMNFDSFLENLSYLYSMKGNISIRMKIADVALDDAELDSKRFEEMFGNYADSVCVEKIIPMFADIDYLDIDERIMKNAINGRENVKQSKVNVVCHRPFYRMRIAANGDVTAACCDSINDIVYGNISENTLVELWEGKKRENLLCMQLEGKRFQHPICKNCVLPNDITTKDDLLDDYAEKILERMQNR